MGTSDSNSEAATTEPSGEGVLEILMGAVRSLEQTVRTQSDLLKRLSARVRELEAAIEDADARMKADSGR